MAERFDVVKNFPNTFCFDLQRFKGPEGNEGIDSGGMQYDLTFADSVGNAFTITYNTTTPSVKVGSADSVSASTISGDNQSITNAGWYIVSGNATLSTEVNITGEVNLIIPEGITLTATVAISGTSTLNVYGLGTLAIDTNGSINVSKHNRYINAKTDAPPGFHINTISSVFIYGSNVVDSINNSGSDVTIQANGGGDEITNSGQSTNVSIFGG